MGLTASQDFSDEIAGDINRYDCLILQNEMCQHLKDLQYFQDDQCMMLQNCVWVKDPFKVQNKPMNVNIIEYKKFTDRI